MAEGLALKLGFAECTHDDPLVKSLWSAMQRSGADFCNTFRALMHVDVRREGDE
jgi:hypothetical protein